MAQNTEQGQVSRTTTLPVAKEKTLVLRARAEDLKKSIGQSIPQNKLLQDAKAHSKNTDAKAAMKKTLDQFRSSINSNLDQMQEEVLSHAPVEPIRRQGQTEAEYVVLKKQYEQEVAQFESYVKEATEIIESVAEVLTRTLDRLQEFSKFLWDLIKAKDPQVDKKSNEFMSKLAKEIEDGFSRDPKKLNKNSNSEKESQSIRSSPTKNGNTNHQSSRGDGPPEINRENKPKDNTM